MNAEFEDWWACYPRKVGKLAAQKAYQKARRLASAQELREGVGRYIQHKPSYADFAHPTTWLTQGRWADEYEPVKSRTVTRDAFEEAAAWDRERTEILARQRGA